MGMISLSVSGPMFLTGVSLSGGGCVCQERGVCREEVFVKDGLYQETARTVDEWTVRFLLECFLVVF